MQFLCSFNFEYAAQCLRAAPCFSVAVMRVHPAVVRKLSQQVERQCVGTPTCRNDFKHAEIHAVSLDGIVHALGCGCGRRMRTPLAAALPTRSSKQPPLQWHARMRATVSSISPHLVELHSCRSSPKSSLAKHAHGQVVHGVGAAHRSVVPCTADLQQELVFSTQRTQPALLVHSTPATKATPSVTPSHCCCCLCCYSRAGMPQYTPRMQQPKRMTLPHPTRSSTAHA